MTYRIRKGKHRAWPWRLGLHYNRRKIVRQVTFEPSCAYQLPGDDHNDTNKLFGLAYLNGVHKDSARFGWRYDNGVVLSAYCYVNGERMIADLCTVALDKPYTLYLYVIPMGYGFSVMQDGKVIGSYAVHQDHKRKWSYPLGVYFGGNAIAPHNMTIKIEKV